MSSFDGRTRFAKFAIIKSSTDGTVDVSASRQLIEDPFEGISSYGQAIKKPPYSLEQLILLAEQNPVHSACLDQRIADLVAEGVQFQPADDDESKDGDDEVEAALFDWWESLFPDMTSLEATQAVADDYVTVAWGAFEIGRNKEGVVERLYHLPGHTLRAHQEGNRYVQIRGGKQVWFRKWGYEHPNGLVLLTNGRWVEPGDVNDPLKVANEVLVFKRPSRRSTWYGIPSYVSAIGDIALSNAARDYNVLFFLNAREVRHLIVVTGLDEEVDTVSEEIEEGLRTMGKEPHRNMVLSLSGSAQVSLHQLAERMTDMSWEKLMDRTTANTLTAHRMPPDRVGITTRGLLGGSSVLLANRIYKDGVISRDQAVFEDRLTRFITKEALPIVPGAGEYRVELEDLDIADENIETTIVDRIVRANIVTLNEARRRLGMNPHEPFGEMTFNAYIASLGGGQGGGGGGQGGGGLGDMFGAGPQGDVIGDAGFGDGALPGSGANDAQGALGALMNSRDGWAVAEYVMRHLSDIDGLIDEMIRAEHPLRP